MSELYICSRCGVATEHDEQVCAPQAVADKQAFCGTAPEPGLMCDCMGEVLPYVCSSCGRPAEQADLVCKPRLLG